MSWQLDKSHSSINFSVRHMMISTARGRFEDFDGTFEINEADPAQSKIDIQVQTASVNTKDAQRDGHLKSPDFFDVEKYPTLTFKSKRVEGKGGQNYRLVGDLTIKEITKEVTLDVEYAGQAKSPWGTVSAGFTAQTKINRKEWDLTWNVALETGGMLVGEDVTISIELELVKQPEAVAEAVA